MRTSISIILAMFLFGCQRSQPSVPLTADQSGTLATRLANDKADTLFHRRPFQGKQPAQFEAGRWIWTESVGAGQLDFQARVEVAADGSTNSVDVKLLDDALHLTLPDLNR